MDSSLLRRMRGGALLVVALVAVGCTSSFMYNRLDTLARWYIGSLVTLDDAQQAAMRDWLGRTLVWHRGSELLRYEQFLQDLAARVSVGPDPVFLANGVQQAEAFMHDLAARAAPDAAALMATLRPQQVEELLGNLDKRNREELAEERARSDADRQKRRIRSMTRSLERWTGSATAVQKAVMERMVNAMATAGLLGEDEDWFASQTAWRGELREALAKGDAGRDDVEALLRSPEKTYTESHRVAEAARRHHFLALIVELDATLTPKQRATLARKLTELALDLQALRLAA